MELIGYSGTILVAVAYLPQIVHLWRFRCAWGISVWSWILWLAASLLLLFYAFVKRDVVFISLQTFSSAASLATIVLYHKRTGTCPYHLTDKE